MINHSYLILLFPLLSFVLGGLWLGRRHWFAAALFAIAMAGAAFAWSLGVAWLWYQQVQGTADFAKPLTAWRVHWLPLDQVLQLRQPLNVDLEMILDPLSVLMLAL